MKILALLIVIITINACCKKNTDSVCLNTTKNLLQTDFSKANIRIKNSTGLDFCQLMFDSKGTLSDMPSKNAINYGALNKNNYTDYHAYDLVFRIAWIKANTTTDSLYTKIIDYFGEVPLESGKYTYELSMGINNSLSIQLIKDQ